MQPLIDLLLLLGGLAALYAGLGLLAALLERLWWPVRY